MKISTTVDIRADAGREIANAFDLLSNVSVPMEAGPAVGATNARDGVRLLTLRLEPLEWRVLAVQLVEARADRGSYLT